MTDRSRNQDQPDRGQQQQSPENPVRRDDTVDDVESNRPSDPSSLDRQSVADDRGLDSDRRSFSGDREGDELGDEMEEDLEVDNQDQSDEGNR